MDVATDPQCDDSPGRQQKMNPHNASKFLIRHGSSVIAPPIKRAKPKRLIPNQDFMPKISVGLCLAILPPEPNDEAAEGEADEQH